MKRKIAAAASMFIILFFAGGAAAEGRLLYMRWVGDYLYAFTSDSGGKNEKRLFKCIDADISGDSKKIAYTVTSDSEGGSREIAVYDVLSGKSRILKNIPPVHNMAPKWSHDCAFLLFAHFREDNGDLCFGIYDIEKDRVKVMFKEALSPLGKNVKTEGLFAPFWSLDGQYVYANDFKYLYKFSVSAGKQEEVIPLADICPKGFEMDASAKFSFLEDGSLLFSVQIADEDCRICKSLVSSSHKRGAFIYFPNEKRTVRIFTDDYCVENIIDGAHGDFYIAAHKKDGKFPKSTLNTGDLYKISDSGKRAELIIIKANNPSFAKQK